MSGRGLIIITCMVLFLKLCQCERFSFTAQVCLLEDNQVGKCVPSSMCPQGQNSVTSIRSCEKGKTCCKISEKIVTPNNGNANAVPGPPPATTTAETPQWVSVTPVVVNPTNGGPPPGEGNPPSIGSSPPNSGPPSSEFSPGDGAGGPSVGSGPPSSDAGGSSPPSPGEAPLGDSSPPGGAPPNGSSPPGGAPPNGAAPPSVPPFDISGNIMVDPAIPQKSIQPLEQTSMKNDEDLESIVVSAEAEDMLDRKCEMYHSMVQRKILSPAKQGTPVVMIYGGTDSEIKEFPHMAALGYGEPNAKQWLCGGSLITENFIVTAAHCLSAPPLGEVRYVKLGSLRLDQDTENTLLFNVVRRIPHEQYNSTTQYNDIALLQLDQPAIINDYVKPICLYSSRNYEDRNLVATGWGKTESSTSSSNNLRKVGLELFTQTECQNAYKMVSKQQLPLGIQEDIQLCAGSHTQSKDTCQGDSGGPLQIRKNNRWYLIGITSIGIRCGIANTPGVYTRVAHYTQWIQQYVWNK